MPSSFSASLRFELQFTGENINLWGDKLNVVLQHADYAVAGWLTKPLTGNVSLSVMNAPDDEARAAMIKFTGGGPFTVTLPSVSKAYDVWNACSAVLTITTGAGSSVSLDPSETVRIICDGFNVRRSQGTEFSGQQLTGLADPTSPQMAATKAYADQLAFTANAGILPGQAGNAGRFIKTDGVNASWQPISSADLTDNAAFFGRAVALAVAL
jgi:hypothetical protein